MATIGSLVVQSVADYTLDFYVRGDMLYQTIQEKPLLAWLEANKSSFPGGKQNISEPVKGSVMNDTAGFFAGYTGDSALTFTQMALGLRAAFAWKEVHAGFVITHTQLKQDGIVVSDGETNTAEAGDVDLVRLTGIMKDAVTDFGESWSRANNSMLWQDGTQDSNQVAGLQALILDSPGAGTVGGLAQATYSWWNSRSKLDLSASAENQTITKFFRNEIKQLRKRGGRPNKILCGSLFWAAIAEEYQAKGIYTQSGFTGKNDIGMDSIAIKGIGEFEYDPTLDDLGRSKHCYVLDSRRTKMRPMENAHRLTFHPARPYQYLVFLKSMTDTLGLTVNQLNGQGVYAIS